MQRLFKELKKTCRFQSHLCRTIEIQKLAETEKKTLSTLLVHIAGAWSTLASIKASQGAWNTGAGENWGRLTLCAPLRSLSFTPSMTALPSTDVHPAHTKQAQMRRWRHGCRPVTHQNLAAGQSPAPQGLPDKMWWGKLNTTRAIYFSAPTTRMPAPWINVIWSWTGVQHSVTAPPHIQNQTGLILVSHKNTFPCFLVFLQHRKVLDQTRGSQNKV